MGNTIAESNVRTKIANASGSQAGTYKREKENDAINTAASNQGVVAERPLKGGETTANPNPTPQVVYLSSNPPTVQAPPTTYVEVDNNGNIIASTDPGIIGDNINGNNNINRPDHVGRRSHRRHNNSNIIALGARIATLEEVIKYIDIFLSTPFDGGRHEGRVNKISNYEK